MSPKVKTTAIKNHLQPQEGEQQLQMLRPPETKEKHANTISHKETGRYKDRKCGSDMFTWCIHLSKGSCWTCDTEETGFKLFNLIVLFKSKQQAVQVLFAPWPLFPLNFIHSCKVVYWNLPATPKQTRNLVSLYWCNVTICDTMLYRFFLPLLESSRNICSVCTFPHYPNASFTPFHKCTSLISTSHRLP